jgi:hypothetical protein
MLIEQAVFTSARTDRAAGYQLVARSPGVREEDARDLSVWGPSHDSLFEDGADAVSVNFFPLPSGAFCISRSEPAGAEYSGRRGAQVYTQCLVVSADVLSRYANNPFAVMTAAFAQGSLRICEDLPKELEPFRLPGRAAAVDQSVFLQLQTDPGPGWVARLLSLVLAEQPVAIVGHPQPVCLLAGLINCLPPSCRLLSSFTTGLKYSSRRPYKINCVPPHQPEQRRLLRQHDIEVVDLGAERSPGLAITSGWPGFVSCALAAGKTSFFASRVGRLGDVTPDALDRNGDQLLEELAARDSNADDTVSGFFTAPAPVEPAPETPTVSAQLEDTTSLPRDRRADGAHDPAGARWSAAVAEATVLELANDPSTLLGAKYPQAQEQLELLDDLVFEAIAGKPDAWDRLITMWPRTISRLPEDEADTYREHYVRYALRLWQECTEGDEVRSPALAVRALDAIAVFFRK